MAARLADIALQAGVSEATVSRVLNDKPGVAPETRRTVLTALDVLGYERPGRLRSRGRLVGLVTADLTNPIFAAFVQTIETTLGRSGYACVVCSQLPGGCNEGEQIELLVNHGVSGIIFVSGQHSDASASHEYYRQLSQRRLPMSLINGSNDGIVAASVRCDDEAAAILAVDHLLALGHRRVGLAVGPERYTPTQGKIAGYREAIQRASLNPTTAEFIECAHFTVEGGQLATLRLLDRGCTAVVCGSDLMALGAIRAIRARGLRVPADVCVIGFDDSPLLAFTDPPLTTVWQPVRAMAEAAVRALIDAMQGQSASRTEYVFRPELVVRESTTGLRPRTYSVG